MTSPATVDLPPQPDQRDCCRQHRPAQGLPRVSPTEGDTTEGNVLIRSWPLAAGAIGRYVGVVTFLAVLLYCGMRLPVN